MILDHMNDDHQAALKKYCINIAGAKVDNDVSLTMVGIYQHGFEINIGDKKIFIPFETPISDTDTARKALILLAKA